MAITAGVRELKNRLTHYLKLVERGEHVIVTDRNRPIAVLRSVKESDVSYDSVAERLASLAREGAVRLGEPARRLSQWKAVPSKGKPASEIISSDRDSR